MRLLALTLLLIAASSPARSDSSDARPSFDCARARLQVEEVICGQAYLSWLDGTLANLYRRVRKNMPEARRKDLLAKQRAWIRTRNTACAVARTGGGLKQRLCLIDAYNARHVALVRLGSSDRSDWTGLYVFRRNGMGGQLRIERAADGTYRVSGESFNRRSRGGSNCGLREKGGKRSDNTIVWPSPDPNAPNATCRITFAGELATITRGCDIGCGAAATMAGPWTRVLRPYKDE